MINNKNVAGCFGKVFEASDQKYRTTTGMNGKAGVYGQRGTYSLEFHRPAAFCLGTGPAGKTEQADVRLAILMSNIGTIVNR